MARMRSLKPEFWLDRKLARSLTRDERMLYLGLWNQADEHARFNADPRVIHGQVFPYEDDISHADIEKMLDSLERVGVLVLYEVEEDPYGFLPNLSRHQRLEPGKVPSRHPCPPEQPPDQQTLIFADESARDSDESARNPDESAQDLGPAQTRPRPAHAKHVAGSREHVAGSREQVTTLSSELDTIAPTGDDPPARFADFWAKYPRREAKRRAEQAWLAALKRAPADTILDGLTRFPFSDNPKFVPLPASWLNADRWADERPPENPIPAWARFD